MRFIINHFFRLLSIRIKYCRIVCSELFIQNRSRLIKKKKIHFSVLTLIANKVCENIFCGCVCVCNRINHKIYRESDVHHLQEEKSSWFLHQMKNLNFNLYFLLVNFFWTLCFQMTNYFDYDDDDDEIGVFYDDNQNKKNK